MREGIVVDRLHLFDDGTISGGRFSDGLAEGVLRARIMVEEETREQAFAFLAKHGWSNGYMMIRLNDLDDAPDGE